MKILFLDIDGVLNSDRSCMAFDGYPHDFSEAGLAKFDNVALGLLRRLVRVTECSVVLSSTWRMYYTPEQASEGLQVPVIDVTPDLGSYETRGSEVAAWLDQHPEVEAFAIVDDIPVFDAFPALQARFVQTNPLIGLNMDDYRQLRHLLAPDCFG